MGEVGHRSEIVLPGSEIPEGAFDPGLAVGESAPDFTLPDQHGEGISFHADRAGARAAVLFYRSAVW